MPNPNEVNPNWSYWDVFSDMFTEDFWQAGGTTEFYADPETANEWVQENVLIPYRDITDSQKTQLIEASNTIANDAMWRLWTTLDSPDDATLYYWQEMKKAVRDITPNDAWLNDFFKTGVTVAKQTTERTFLTDPTAKKKDKGAFPWWLVGLVGLVLLVKK